MAFKILYVEDNSDNMHLIQKVLTARGYEVYGAVNGLDGVSRAEDLKPDLILLDFNLPDIDGYELARRIRKNQETGLHSVTMIAITANVLAGDAEKALAAGCDAYMPKPINVHELAVRVETHLSKNVG